MKAVFCLLALLPLALSFPHSDEEELEKRFLLDTFQNLAHHLPSPDWLTTSVVDTLGSDTTEAACETACNTALNALAPGLSLLGHDLVHSACLKFQSTVQG